MSLFVLLNCSAARFRTAIVPSTLVILCFAWPTSICLSNDTGEIAQEPLAGVGPSVLHPPTALPVEAAGPCEEPLPGTSSGELVAVERYEFIRAVPTVLNGLKRSCDIRFALSDASTSDVKLLLVMKRSSWGRIRSLKLAYFGKEVFTNDTPIEVKSRVSVLHLRLNQPIYTHYPALVKGAQAKELHAVDLTNLKTQRALEDDEVSSMYSRFSDYSVGGYPVPGAPVPQQLEAPAEMNYLWITDFQWEFK